MKTNANLIEGLIEKTVEYGKSSLEIAKLKAIDKTSDVVSSLMTHSVVIVILFSFLLFLNLGLALWIGKILGEIYYGFFVVAGFYGIVAILVFSFMRKWIKRTVGNSFIKQVLK
jgi:hypothetical protein